MRAQRKWTKLTNEEIFELRENDQEISHSAFATKTKISTTKYYTCLIQKEDLTEEQRVEIEEADWKNRTEFVSLFPLIHPEVSGVVFKKKGSGCNGIDLYLRCKKIMDKVGTNEIEISETYNSMKYKKVIEFRLP